MKYFLCSQDVMHPGFPNLPLCRQGDIISPAKVETLRHDGVDCLAGFWCDSTAAVNVMRLRMADSEQHGFTHIEVITLHAALSAAVAALDPYL